MPARPWSLFAGIVLSLYLLAPQSSGAIDAVAPASERGGPSGSSLAVKVDLPGARVLYQTCPSLPCAVAPESPSVSIGLEKASLPDPEEVITRVLPVGDGKSLVHVRVPFRGGGGQTPALAWEGLFAAGAAPPFAGITGWTRGETGERTGSALRFDDQGGTIRIAKGDIEEDFRICGEDATLLHPQWLNPATLAWVGVSLPLSPARVAEATRLVASLRARSPADPPLVRLLAAEGASSAVGAPNALSDGDPNTTWSEGRSGQGPGEFVLFHAPHEVPLTRFAVAVAPKVPKAGGAAPRIFYLATDSTLFEISMPEDAWGHPGAAYDVVLPDPARTSCVALVLGNAFTRGNPRPEVTIAELYAYSDFDAPGATLDGVAVALAGGGPRAEAASGILKRSELAGLKAVERAYGKLDAAGRALAVDVAASAASCSVPATLLVRALSDPEAVVREKARAKLEQPHCGRDAVPALVAALGVPETRARSATLLAMVAPGPGLQPIAEVIGRGSPTERSQLRSALARAAAGAMASDLATLLSDGRAPEARVELLRASEERLRDVRDAADRALDELFLHPPSPGTRYLLASPVAALARAGDAKDEERLVELLERDADPLVRTRAAELAGASPRTQAALDSASKDSEPRVREAALHTVGASRVVSARGGAILALGSDPWTFVRVEAAGALGTLPASPASNEALGGAIADKAPNVRMAAIGALAQHAAAAYAGSIRSRLDDAHENLEVRVAAAHALGALCDAGSARRLTDYAVAGASSPDSDEVALGLAATAALGQLHPRDLENRLKKVHVQGARPDARRAADAALAERGTCP